MLLGASYIAMILWLVFGKVMETYRFDPPENISGIYLGVARNDLIFKTDLRWSCVPPELAIQNCDVMTWIDNASYAKFEKSGVTKERPRENGNVVFENERVVRIQQVNRLNKYLFNFNGVDELITQLGEPDILSIAKNLKSRTYTYVDERWSFTFQENNVTGFIWGKLSVWDSLNAAFVSDKPLELLSDDELLAIVDEGSEIYTGNQYFISGEKICPSPRCPFSEGEPLGKSDKKYLEPSELKAKLLYRERQE